MRPAMIPLIAMFILCSVSSIVGCGGNASILSQSISASISSQSTLKPQNGPERSACSSASAPPPPAANYGLSVLAFCDDFDSTSTIDIKGTGIAGFQWYTNLPFGWGKTKPPAFTISQSVLTVTSSVKGSNWALTTRDPITGNGNSWRFGYFEARISFNPGLVSQSAAWPAFWGMSSNKLQHNDIREYSELDFFEALVVSEEHVDGFLGTIHDWQDGMNIDYFNQNDWQETHTDWSQWHTVGVLWVPGSVTWYLDGNPLMSQLYWSNSGPSPSAIGANVVYPTPPGIFSNIDDDPMGQQIVIGSDPNWPLMIDWVRVWSWWPDSCFPQRTEYDFRIQEGAERCRGASTREGS